MSATQFHSNVLVLTTDPDQRAKLQRKLEDYTKRYEFQAPEVDPGATYRYRLLGELLKKEIVDLGEFEARHRADTWFRFAAFSEAVAIIDSYNSGDLSKIRGGTGLT